LEIGVRIRKLRLQQGRTIQEIADICHFSKGLLSKIETGKVVPAIATLSKIADSLGVKISALMEEDNTFNVAVTPNMLASSQAFIATSKGYAMVGLAPHFLNKKMQPLLICSEKKSVKPHSVSHQGEEFIYVLRGSVKIHVGTTEYILNQDESVYFECENEHGVLPLTDVVMYLDIFIG
jgi:transcriptional regulator with XRE-family HTH domain